MRRRSFWLLAASLGALTLFVAAQALATAGNGAVTTTRLSVPCLSRSS